MSTPPRHWFQFSLRALMVVVTLCGIPLGWLAHEASIVRQRQFLISKLHAADDVWVKDFNGTYEFFSPPEQIRKRDFSRDPSKFRSWLGDHFVNFIGFDRDLTADGQAVLDAFPEAEILVWHSAR